MLDDDEALARVRIDDFLDDRHFFNDWLRGRDFLSNDRNFDDRFL